jgi:hypothetical protein
MATPVMEIIHATSVQLHTPIKATANITLREPNY